ncbi:CubicO group peptidase (beta-lactamase class C family) [Caulobacter ginsengisoli]|uniref:CubicO group peptidase (Beta-lactamase class C family) n=1 Tax=Caulobacter ginsengisoli TaxID=400775 RepID=A0ABU0IPP7_9CAUL|nr:serine hydrolase domain-containing protein [Caulobacter ginsengisoli]MDQ0463351.1 CubicO group peptidase (beta-lactamase class C family) [Caulobacter ginsengisoli]
MTSLDQVLTAADPEAAPGLVAGIVRKGGAVELAATGARSKTDPAAMTKDSVFWIASCTKLVTSIAVLQLVDDGKVGVEDLVADHLPAFADLPIFEGFDADGKAKLRPSREPVRIRHLLTHTSGCSYPFTDADLGRYAQENGIEMIEGHRLPRLFEAGTRWQYGVSTEWLGLLITAVTGKPLATVFEERIFQPLGMADTSFVLDARLAERAAGMHARIPGVGLAPIPFAMPPPPSFIQGGGGLYSTAPDYLKLLGALVEGGGKLLSPGSMKLLTSNQVGEIDCGVFKAADPTASNDFDPLPGRSKRWSLGAMYSDEAGGDGRSEGSFAWAGLANCYYWVDPKAGVAGVLFAQVLPFADPKVLDVFSAVERAAYGAGEHLAI